MEKRAAPRILFSSSEESTLGSMLLSPPVLMKGRLGRRIVWTRELDLGSLWLTLATRADLARSPNNAHRTARKDGSRKRQRVYTDVRDARAEAARAPRWSKDHVAWQKWLRRVTTSAIASVPQWCIDLSKTLREKSGG
jgi:hypothetical protein